MPKRGSRSKPKEEEKPNPELSKALSIAFSVQEIKVLDNISDLLQDEKTLLEMAELANSGASLRTIEMSVGLSSGILERWMRNGKVDKDGPFRILFLFLSRASSQARLAAECQLLAKNPEKWLERIDISTQLDKQPDSQPPAPMLDGNTISARAKPQEGLTFLEVGEDDLSIEPEPEKET